MRNASWKGLSSTATIHFIISGMVSALKQGIETAGGSVGRVQNSVSFPFSAVQPAGKEQQASDGLFNTGWKNREFPGNPVVTLRQRAQNILEMPKEKLLHTQIYPAGAFHSSCAVLTAEEGAKIEGVWGQLEKIP